MTVVDIYVRNDVMFNACNYCCQNMVCKQCQNCVYVNDKQVQNGVADIGMVQPISS